MAKMPWFPPERQEGVFSKIRFEIQNTSRSLAHYLTDCQFMTVAPLKTRQRTADPSGECLWDGENPLWISHAFTLKGLIPPGLLLLAACLLLPVDVWVSLHSYKIPLGQPKFLRNILDNVEPFGHAVGVVVAGLSVMLLDARQWKTGFSVLCAGLGAGLLADVAKLLIGRVRPRNFDFDTLDVRATFEGWLPLFNGSSASQSFPSAHTATAFAMAVMLSSLYPRGRVLFFLLAFLVAGHRLHSGRTTPATFSPVPPSAGCSPSGASASR